MINDTSYANLLFDLGGVIMDLDRLRCVKALNALGMATADEFLGLYAQTGPFAQLEEGAITPDEFRCEIRRHIAGEVSDAELDDAFNQFLIGIPAHRLESLRELKKTYKIFMLSNTNSIMFDSKIRECFRIEGRELEDYFDGIITSYEAGSSKPDDKIFNYTISTLKIDPKDTLFFDDSQKNLDTAARFGFGTYLVRPNTEFMEYFSK